MYCMGLESPVCRPSPLDGAAIDSCDFEERERTDGEGREAVAVVVDERGAV